MDIKELQKHIDQVMQEQNNRSLPEFEGYSPFEMHQILHFTFGADSPLKLKKLSEADYKRIPLLNSVKFLLDLIDKNGELKLTKTGNLPIKVVSELYQQGIYKEEWIEKGFKKLYKETDCAFIHLTRIMTELCGLTKKRKGKLSLTKAAKAIISDYQELFRLLLITFATKLNWAYFDGYGENQIGQLGYGFSLLLLSKYGQQKRLDTFYADKYFKAFPQLLDNIQPSYGTLESYTARCYSIRTFDCFLHYFGLIKIDIQGYALDEVKHITRTPLFERLIECKPHQVV